MYRFSEHTSSTAAWKIFPIPSYHGYTCINRHTMDIRVSSNVYVWISEMSYWKNQKTFLNLPKLSSKIPLHSTLKLNAGNGNWYQISSNSDFKIITWFYFIKSSISKQHKRLMYMKNDTDNWITRIFDLVYIYMNAFINKFFSIITKIHMLHWYFNFLSFNLVFKWIHHIKLFLVFHFSPY